MRPATELDNEPQVDLSDATTFRVSSIACLKRTREQQEKSAADENEELIQWQKTRKTNGHHKPLLKKLSGKVKSLLKFD